MEAKETKNEGVAKMTSCMSRNSKTMYSVDFTTNCPKRRAGNPCRYCYVECARNMGFNAKLVNEYLPYKGEVLKLSKEVIEKLNNMGGIRLFSFGDYMPEHDGDIKAFLGDCQKVNLKVKAITKQAAFIAKYAKYPAMNVIHISIDNVGDGVPWVMARALRKFSSNVKIRGVVMNDVDISEMSNGVGKVDVYTFNHGRGLKEKYGWKLYSKKEVKDQYEKLNGSVCCLTGKCESCSLKCAA